MSNLIVFDTFEAAREYACQQLNAVADEVPATSAELDTIAGILVWCEPDQQFRDYFTVEGEMWTVKLGKVSTIETGGTDGRT